MSKGTENNAISIGRIELPDVIGTMVKENCRESSWIWVRRSPSIFVLQLWQFFGVRI